MLTVALSDTASSESMCRSSRVVPVLLWSLKIHSLAYPRRGQNVQFIKICYADSETVICALTTKLLLDLSLLWSDLTVANKGTWYTHGFLLSRNKLSSAIFSCQGTEVGNVEHFFFLPVFDSQLVSSSIWKSLYVLLLVAFFCRMMIFVLLTYHQPWRHFQQQVHFPHHQQTADLTIL